MTDQPYTDEDLRIEAARQHYVATIDPDYVGIGEQMDGHFVESTIVDPDPQTGTEPVTGTTWEQLSREDFDAAQRAVDRLLTSAADVSEWAINLGADSLEPAGHTFQLGARGTGDDDPEEAFVRLHFAFSPGVPDEQRDRFVMQLTKVISANL